MTGEFWFEINLAYGAAAVLIVALILQTFVKYRQAKGELATVERTDG